MTQLTLRIVALQGLGSSPLGSTSTLLYIYILIYSYANLLHLYINLHLAVLRICIELLNVIVVYPGVPLPCVKP